MVYLDSLFHGVRASKAFECLHNFIESAAKVQGKQQSRERWEFYVIPPSDIPQHNSVDCGVFVVKWAQHISQGRLIDFDQSNIDDFCYSLILDIANNKLSCLVLPPTAMNHLCYDVGAKHPGKMQIIEDISTSAPDDILHVHARRNGISHFGDHIYAIPGQTHVSEKANKEVDVIPKWVKNILPSTFTYKYLEYEELPSSNSSDPPSNNYQVKFNIMHLSTKEEVKQWVSEFAASSNIKYNTQAGCRRKGIKVIFAQWYICQCKQKKANQAATSGEG